jgi:hypothetical protein
VSVAARWAESLGRRENIPERFSEFLAWVGLVPSPVIAAIADASQGIRPTLDGDLAQAVFGCSIAELPLALRRVIVARAGGRGGKTSRLLAPKAVHAAMTVPLPTLAPEEHAVALIVAPRALEAKQALSFCRGVIASKPELRNRVVNIVVQRGAERLGTTDCITLRRYDGKLVDIRIGVASSGGLSARAKTLVFCGMDEAAFFRAEGAHTDKDLYQAAIQRVVPGGQVWMVSTPWIEGFGVMEELYGEDWGRHEQTLCATGTTRMLNPTWDPDHTIEAHLRRTDPDNASREIDAVPLPAGSKLFFPPELIARAVNDNRPLILEPDLRFSHFAGMDLGFRKNSSALVIVRDEGPKLRLAYMEEVKMVRGQRPPPSVICKGFATACGRYSVWSAQGDLHYSETAREHFGETPVPDPAWRGMNASMRTVAYEEFIPTAESVSKAFGRGRDLMGEGRLELPNHAGLLSEMRRTTARPTPGGGIKVELPRIGNSHGDLSMATFIAVGQHRDNAYDRLLDQMTQPTKAAIEPQHRSMFQMPKAG